MRGYSTNALTQSVQNLQKGVLELPKEKQGITDGASSRGNGWKTVLFYPKRISPICEMNSMEAKK